MGYHIQEIRGKQASVTRQSNHVPDATSHCGFSVGTCFPLKWLMLNWNFRSTELQLTTTFFTLPFYLFDTWERPFYFSLAFDEKNLVYRNAEYDGGRPASHQTLWESPLDFCSKILKKFFNNKKFLRDVLSWSAFTCKQIGKQSPISLQVSLAKEYFSGKHEVKYYFFSFWFTWFHRKCSINCNCQYLCWNVT